MFPLYVENLLLTVGVFIILAWACYLPLLGGQLFNGPIYFAAISAYFAAYTAKVAGWPIPLAFFGGVAFSGVLAWGMAYFLAPLTMFQMAVVTIALIFIVQTIFRNLDFLGGVIGMSGIPQVENLLLICVICILISLFLISRLYKSRWGRAMEAVEHDRPMAESMGVDLIKMSVVLQVASALMGGLAGVIYAFNLGSIHPDVFGFGQLLYCFTIVFVGGRFTPWGPLIMAPVLWLIPEFFPSAIAEFRNIFYGVIVIVSLLVRPKGIITKGLVMWVEKTLKKSFNRVKGGSL
jgi:branched-chain amino acid transport system permease protein